MTRRCAIAFAGLLLAATAAAQDRPAAPRLVPTGRLFARGDGVVTRCLITADSTRALTVGAEHDLVWWDLRERRPLRHIDPQAAPIDSVRLHPSEPWLVCVGADGTGLRVDLLTGARQALTELQVTHLNAPVAGAWLGGGLPAAPDADIVSANGQHRLVLANGTWRRQPTTGQFFFGDRLWLADDGTVVVANGTTLQLRGLTFGDRTEAAVHCGAPQRLVFTPDGNHLAVLGVAATQVADLAGDEIARLPGPRLVQPGPGPDEFWLLTAHGMQRWSATHRKHVGEQVTWPGRHLRLSEERLVEGRLVDVLRPVLVRDGQPWTPEAARLPDGTFRALAFTPAATAKPANGLERYAWLGPPETGLAFAPAGALATPMLLTSAPGDIKFTRARATLRRLGADGATTDDVAFDAAARWLLTTPNHSRVGVGLANGTVRLFDGERLTPLATADFAPPLVAAVALGAAHVLASDGRKLLRLDATTLAVIDELPLPPGLAGIDQLASSDDGRRLAIARGSAVRILSIE